MLLLIICLQNIQKSLMVLILFAYLGILSINILYQTTGAKRRKKMLTCIIF